MTINRAATYAIEGYYYQFDFSILSILNTSNVDEPITLEGVEDVDLWGERIQVKYHSTQKYTSSKIKKPILEFLRHYQNNKGNQKYILYAHFNDMSSFNSLDCPEVLRIIESERNTLSLSNTDIDEFVRNNFEYREADDIESQRANVKSLISQELNVTPTEVNEHYYPKALHQIINICTKRKIDERSITKRCFKGLIDNKVFLFSYWLALLKGEEDYKKYVKRELKKHNALKHTKSKCIVVGKNLIGDNMARFSCLCKSIIEIFFELEVSLYDSVPLWFVFDIPKEKIAEIQSNLLDKKCIVRTGKEIYKFNPEFFNDRPIINRTKTTGGRVANKIARSSYVARMITLSTYKEYYSKLKKPDVLIIAGPSECVPVDDIPQVYNLTEIRKPEDILEILSR